MTSLKKSKKSKIEETVNDIDLKKLKSSGKSLKFCLPYPSIYNSLDIRSFALLCEPATIVLDWIEL